jgi:N,N'-diacetyllegionaminate synthase
MKTIVIAEIGVNHNGSIFLAKKLIKKIASTGANYVKFQAFNPDLLVTPTATLAGYQRKNLKQKITQKKMLSKYALSEKQMHDLQKYSKKNRISFLLSIFDSESLKIVKKLKLNVLKIPSGEINNLPLLQEISKLNIKVILSTGMANEKEIREAIKILTSKKIKKTGISLLQCNTDYPTKYSDINLNTINAMKNCFKTKVGFSDHTDSYIIPSLAVCKGAQIIEKHVTLNKKMNGPDHKASIEISDFAKMINLIKITEKTFGSAVKKPTKSEIKNIKIIRKSIVSTSNISKGDFFSKKNLITKRPGQGISPMLINVLIGKKSKNNYLKDQLIKKSEIKK